jgi:glycosyltransferase involved in cell wall biosynthesis
MTAIYAAPVSKLLSIKLVNGMVTDSPKNQKVYSKSWFRARITFLFADIIIGNSKAGLQAYNAPKNKSIVIYNGFNFNRTAKIIPKENIRDQLSVKTKYIIGMVAANSIFKDYLTYFKAKLLLNKRKDITFLAVGNNTDSESFKDLINNHIKYFRLLGYKSDVESLINVMDICILSTYTEGISNSILEYMAFGKPVIATAGGGTNEIIENQKTGILISQSNPSELAENIEILLNNSQLGQEMGLAGKKKIQCCFSIENMADKFVTIYNNLIADR